MADRKKDKAEKEAKQPHVVATAELPGISILIRTGSESYQQAKAVGFKEQDNMVEIVRDKEIVSVPINLVADGYHLRVTELSPLKV